MGAEDFGMAASGKNTPLSTFDNVMARIFPLPADPFILQGFVDKYLNDPCHSGGNYFRVAMPLVYLQLLDYGSMSGRLTGRAHTSQNELLFMVVLEWFEICSKGTFKFNGKYYRRHAEGHALVTPFIFVDNPLSVMMGRENFGWPKSLINVSSVAPGWAPEAGDSVPIMRIGAMRLAQFYEGKSQRFSTIMEIEKRAGFSDGTTGIPLDPVQALTDLWSGSKRSLDTLMQQWRDIFDLRSSNIGMITQMLERYRQTASGNTVGTGSLAQWFASLGNSIGVKHFSDPENPNESCFETLANMRTEVTKMYGAGLLGSMESQVSSLDGGFRIRVHRYEAYPALKTLGIKVSREEAPAKEGDPPIDILTPLMPFWYRMNFSLQTSIPLLTRVHGESFSEALDSGQLCDYKPEFTPSMGQETSGGVTS
ncbi:hypothetical protein N9359_02720 [Luminiphilus sp.]|jgi:hypothetical protein|nr:hypothetical protein [Luminiphilus sp.]MDB3922995.1 hypothetical protein [Luminiphilus sp.]